jgi:hypothetical protein
MSRHHELVPPIDDSLRGAANATTDELKQLAAACREFGISAESKLVLARMASYPPPLRLAINLRTVIALMMDKSVRDVLHEGLLPEEYAVLVELDMRALPSRVREIAHGLFNVHERWCLLKRLRQLFRPAWASREHYLKPNGDAAVDNNNNTKS